MPTKLCAWKSCFLKVGHCEVPRFSGLTLIMAWDAITRIPVKDPYILREDVNLQFTPKQGPKIIQVKLNSVSLDFFAILAEDCSNPRRYLSQPSGPDLVIEVPLSRWDVDQYFDPEAPRPIGRSRHGFGICGSSLNHELGVCLCDVPWPCSRGNPLETGKNHGPAWFIRGWHRVFRQQILWLVTYGSEGLLHAGERL